MAEIDVDIRILYYIHLLLSWDKDVEAMHRYWDVAHKVLNLGDINSVKNVRKALLEKILDG